MEAILTIVGVVVIILTIIAALKDGIMNILSYFRDFTIMIILGIVIGAICHWIIPIKEVPWCLLWAGIGVVYELYHIVFNRGNNPILLSNFFIGL